MPSLTSAEELAVRARDDIGVFAEVLVGEPLWDHQLEMARSPARIRVGRLGRQAGKSRFLAVLALHEAFRAADRHVLILSAGDDSAKDLLAEVVELATSSPLLAGSVVDETTSRLVLSNGSWVRSIPASPKQARGKSIDLLVLDEACFIDEDVWRAAKYTQAARPGSRLVMTSSPFGRRDRFFAVHDRMGEGGLVEVAGVSVEAFHWPSTVSPLVRAAGLVEFWRRTDPSRVFQAEVLAEWTDEAGAFFTPDEITGAVGDFDLVDPVEAHGQEAVAGVDWGFANDAQAVVVLAGLDDRGANAAVFDDDGRVVFWVPYLEHRHRCTYTEWVEHLVTLAGGNQAPDGFWLQRLVSETNGVGSMPTEVLERRVWEERTGSRVAPVHTTARRKQHAFGGIKLLLQQRRLLLPRHPELLRQLDALEFATTESGTVQISVPERAGHDDLAMALAQAVSVVRPEPRWPWPTWPPEVGEWQRTEGGVLVPPVPRCLEASGLFTLPRGEDGREEGWWAGAVSGACGSRSRTACRWRRCSGSVCASCRPARGGWAATPRPRPSSAP